ncbi:hypothetical protein [Streptomyces sp. TRM70350]|uniref:hypothetical protein n=1 Tax=Streptomyces sp. TRM70350 TaxID=2856165 RepID=UPI001C44DC1D|nr:hypothetical protein [Streptomyces sp. TRM70350]MBV7700693.1 hypothetical protein [Streptomyces sp. TRM70350]
MSRRVPHALRVLSGALLVCALVLCLSGLARPAMTMPGQMGMTPPALAGERASGQMSADAAGLAAGPMAESPDRSAQCPMAEQRCTASKAVLAQDGPAAPALTALPQPIAACSPMATMAQPNAPPPSLPPPDLHRLCVSRT